jgi:transcriptional regulator with XRE-family HTH domain
MTASVQHARAVAVEFSRRMRAARLAAGLTQKQLAALSGVRPPFISRIERGIGNPSLMTMSLLAQALERELPDLLRQETAD